MFFCEGEASNSPGGFETEIPQWQLQESAALAQGQILRRNAVDVMYDIQVSQAAFRRGYGSWDDVLHEQHTQPTVTSSIENKPCKRRPENRHLAALTLTPPSAFLSFAFLSAGWNLTPLSAVLSNPMSSFFQWNAGGLCLFWWYLCFPVTQ